MRILIISHNALSCDNNMGKTLLSQFAGCKNVEIAQLYTHEGTPDKTAFNVCSQYYSFSDIDALNSILRPWINGKNYTVPVRVENGNSLKHKVYKRSKGIKLIPFIVREFVWFLSNWKNKSLYTWIKRFSPDVIYLVPGAYPFIYKIAQRISADLTIPIVVSIMDDYYFNNPLSTSGRLGRLCHHHFLKHAEKTLTSAKAIQLICEEAVQLFGSLNANCFSLYTTAEEKKLNFNASSKKISYIGNISLGRWAQLVKLGKALKHLNLNEGPRWIDVYTAETKQEYLQELTEENGIKMHGKISPAEVLMVMENSMAVIHTESFDQPYRDMVRSSVSTKIAESLAYGPCLLAFGPSDVASIAHLKRNNAAYIIDDESKLEEQLCQFINNKDLRRQLLDNARQTATKYHNSSVNHEILVNIIQRSLSLLK